MGWEEGTSSTGALLDLIGPLPGQGRACSQQSQCIAAYLLGFYTAGRRELEAEVPEMDQTWVPLHTAPRLSFIEAYEAWLYPE